MKTLRILTAAVLLAVSFSACATEESLNEKLSVNYTLRTYIDALANGRIQGLGNLFDPGAKFTLTRGNRICNYSKDEVIEFMKSLEGVKQNCETNSAFLQLDNAQALVKITMKYSDFSKVTLVTMHNSNRGWKITNISSSFI